MIEGGSNSVVPSFGTSTDAVVITNREYVRDVYCPLSLKAFQIADSIALNPGLGESFPWLSQVAMNYEEYEFMQLAVTFKSTIDQSLATNGQSGQVALTTSYNADSDPFGSKQEMMAYSGGMSCKTNQSMIHGIECDPAKNSGSPGKYVRPGYVTTGTLKDFDLGCTYLSILDAPTQFLGVTLGELWVSYTVVLRKPKLSVGENYNVGRITGCCQNQLYPFPFGQQGDASFLVSTKSTIPVKFIRPLVTADVPNPYLPVSTTAIPQDQINKQTFKLFNNPIVPFSIAVQFPPWFSGIVEIKIYTHSMGANSPGLPFQYNAQGQIHRYQDIPLREAQPNLTNLANIAWTHTHSMAGFSTAEGPFSQTNYQPSQLVILHIRVMPANAGIPNIVWFGWSDPNSAKTYNSYIEVNGINTYLSLDDAHLHKARMVLEQADNDGVPAVWA